MFLEIENLSIQNDLYKKLLVETGVVNLEGLEKLEAAALADSVLRLQAHQKFSSMWETVEMVGTDALFQELLDELPPTDKPN